MLYQWALTGGLDVCCGLEIWYGRLFPPQFFPPRRQIILKTLSGHLTLGYDPRARNMRYAAGCFFTLSYACSRTCQEIFRRTNTPIRIDCTHGANNILRKLQHNKRATHTASNLTPTPSHCSHIAVLSDYRLMPGSLKSMESIFFKPYKSLCTHTHTQSAMNTSGKYPPIQTNVL